MAIDMSKATTLEQFQMLANEAADYTDEQDAKTLQSAQQYTDEKIKDVALPAGGTAGQILVKKSASDYDAGWASQNFTYEQMTASAEWTVAHNLGRFPGVTVVDSSGNKVIGDVQYTSANSLVIRFSAPFSGTAYLN